MGINNVKYENVYSTKPHPKVRQIPFMELNGEQIPDSNLIMRRLTDVWDIKCDEELTEAQKALAHTVSQMLEHHTIQIAFYWRYGHHVQEFEEKLCANFQYSKRAMWFFRKLQPCIMRLAGYLRGFARHSFGDIAEMSFRDIDAISQLLGSNRYFLGTTHPCTIDCTVFGHLVQLLYIPMAVPQKSYIQQHCQNLVQFVDRIRDEVWPDWEEMCRAECMEGKMGTDYVQAKG